mgnify:CR=1 FL=1
MAAWRATCTLRAIAGTAARGTFDVCARPDVLEGHRGARRTLDVGAPHDTSADGGVARDVLAPRDRRTAARGTFDVASQLQFQLAYSLIRGEVAQDSH